MPDRAEFIDTHCHLDDEQFDEDRDKVWAAAQAAGVVAIVNPGSSVEDSQRTVALAQGTSGVFAAVGMHPHYLPKDGPQLEESIATLEQLSQEDKVVAIGECGFDVKHGRDEMDQQRRALTLQLELAATRNLPVILHCRQAYAELAQVLAEFAGIRGVVHSFAGGPADLKLMLDLGLYVALGGIVTFEKGTEALRAAAKQVPLERLLLETDAPYLTPPPNRGKRNEPLEVTTVARFVAELRGTTYANLAAATTRNARQLFSLDSLHSVKETRKKESTGD